MNTAGETIRNARLRSGLSQREVARRAGTSQAAISRIERGLEEPTFERFEQILAGMGWRPVPELVPLTPHDVEPRLLYMEARKPPDRRLEGGLAMNRFGVKLAGAARR
jgi:transcriptional regulator with XRE-family HTH domain